MYNAGFGDAFLVLVDYEGQPPRKVLIDCGSHSQGHPEGGLKAVAREIVDAARADEPDGEPRLQIVVATHRHQDHIAGFGDAALWRNVQVAEVWMPWTEHPTDPDAARIRDAQQRLALELSRRLQPVHPLRDLVLNAAPNAAAMATLHRGFAGRPKRRFLPAPSGPGTFGTPALPGVQVHLFGPSRDEDVIREMDPPVGQSYLRLGEGLGFGVEPDPPFRQRWIRERDDVRSRYPHLMFSNEELKWIDGSEAAHESAAAVALEKAVNGTSLMFMLEIGSAHLLFPGDAQWGTWEAARARPENRELLSQTTLYKVGHHGSHNATPRAFVEDDLQGLAIALVSVKAMKIWPSIPRLPLLEALAGKAAVIRSDEALPSDGSPQVTRAPDGGYTEVRVAVA